MRSKSLPLFLLLAFALLSCGETGERRANPVFAYAYGGSSYSLARDVYLSLALENPSLSGSLPPESFPEQDPYPLPYEAKTRHVYSYYTRYCGEWENIIYEDAYSFSLMLDESSAWAPSMGYLESKEVSGVLLFAHIDPNNGLGAEAYDFFLLFLFDGESLLAMAGNQFGSGKTRYGTYRALSQTFARVAAAPYVSPYVGANFTFSKDVSSLSAYFLADYESASGKEQTAPYGSCVFSVSSPTELNVPQEGLGKSAFDYCGKDACPAV